jgi:putative transposase
MIEEVSVAQSLADVILHFVFSTKERNLWIQSNIEEELYQYMSGVCRNLNSPVIKINGVEDHIHILLHLGKTIPISKLISEMKSSSSRWIKTKGDHYRDFAWQGGYGGFSVSRPNLEGAKKYLASQKEHHKTVTFKEEFLTMLQRSQIPYDEKYLWD